MMRSYMSVMPGLVPGIHETGDVRGAARGWSDQVRSSPAMTSDVSHVSAYEH